MGGIFVFTCERYGYTFVVSHLYRLLRMKTRKRRFVRSRRHRLSQTTQAAQSFASERRVANGGTVSSSSPSWQHQFFVSAYACDRRSSTRLTVHTTKVSELRVRIHRPRRYDDAAPAVNPVEAGDCDRHGYNCIGEPERRRICELYRSLALCDAWHGHVVSSTIDFSMHRRGC